MANVYAVKSGDWSDETVWNTGALPTSADDVFANTFTVTIDQNVTVLSIRNTSATGISQGGGFILNGELIVTCPNGVIGGINTCLTFSALGTSTINGGISALTATPAVYTYTLVHNGGGTLNINGNLSSSGTCNNRGCLIFSGSGNLNVVGNINGGFCNSPNVNITGSGTVNIVGSISGGSNVTALNLTGSSKTTITGNLSGGANTGRAIVISENALLSVTGNLLPGGNSGNALNAVSGSPNIQIVGNIGDGSLNGVTLFFNQTSAYVKVIGTIFVGNAINFISTPSNAINILSGPFISGVTGILPISVTRMHYQRTIGSYYEFRDSSTNGALPPAAPAPAARLVSPDTLADPPIPANVRQGVVYAFSSQTGTMVVPNPINVAAGVPVDDTVGTAALNPSDIWDASIDSLNTLNSIGRRLKNAATVETTGAQLENLIGNNE